MIEIIKGSFKAGEVKTFLIQGEYLEILESAYPIDIAMMDRSGAQLSTMRAAEASYFSRPGKYEVIQVTSSAAQTVRLFVGSGDAGTRRTSGDVSVVDGGKSRTISNSAFAGYSSCTAAAATIPHVELWNPVASKVRLVVEVVRLGSGTATDLYLNFVNSALTTKTKNATSKLSGGIDSSAEIRTQNNAVSLGSGILFVEFGPMNESRCIELKEPIVLNPGWGLIGRTNSENTDVAVNFEFYEELI